MDPLQVLFLGRMGSGQGVGIYYPSGARVIGNTPEAYFKHPWSTRHDPLSDFDIGRLLTDTLQTLMAAREQPEGLPICKVTTPPDHPWTLYAFWDRSGDDKRFGNLSAFLIPGIHLSPEADKLAREAYPLIFARIDRHLGRSDEGTALRKCIQSKLDTASLAHLQAIAVILGFK